MPHYTSENYEAFTERITLEFIGQIAQRLEECNMPQSELAKKLNVSESEVSQVLNLNRTNLTLKTMVRYASAVGMKPAVVAYDDGDPQNDNGPIGSQVFSLSWEAMGKPRNLQSVSANLQNTVLTSVFTGLFAGVAYWQNAHTNATLAGINLLGVTDIPYPMVKVEARSETKPKMGVRSCLR